MAETMIEIRNLSKAFNGTRVLKDLDLTLHEGDNIVILGKSGIGKSVLTKCIVGLLNHDEGSIELFGKDINQISKTELDELRMNIGYLFQGGALYDSMSVKENLEFPIKRSRFLGLSEINIEQRIEEVLNNIGLIEEINKMPSELSGGMKKRIGLARALILRPRIIFYDEPTTGLDPVTAAEISELIIKVQEDYKTSSIIITHDMNCARITSNEIKLMKDGKFYASGTYDEMKNHKEEEVRAYFKTY